jgi:ammonium transporter, Amt family
MRIRLGMVVVSVIWIASSSAGAQEITPASDTARFLFDTAMLLASALGALVFVFAFGLRDVGLARLHNTPAVCLRMLGLVAVSGLAFWISGYNLIHLIEKGGLLGEFQVWRPNDDDPMAAGYPSGIHWFAQMGLAAMVAAIVSSAVSERVKLWPFLIFTAALAGLIYPIITAWTWGGGYLNDTWRFYDFGGAGVIHITGGAAALAAAFVVGPRPGKYAPGAPARQAPSDALPLTAFGAGLMWVSLLLVMAGMVKSFSTVEAAISVGSLMATSLMAASGAVLTALFLTQVVYKRVGLVTASCAAVGGLVAIAADPLHPSMGQAAMIGAVAGVIVTVAPPFLNRFRIDDAGLVVPTHLFCGLWGVIVVEWSNPNTWFMGQLVGAAAIAAFASLLSLLIWIALKYTLGARLRATGERRGGTAGEEDFSDDSANG